MMASYDFFFKAQQRGMLNGSMERSVSLKNSFQQRLRR